MPEGQITTIELGNYLDRQIDDALELLKRRNPGVDLIREQLIRLTVGYGLDQIVRRHERKKVHLYGYFHKVYPAEEEKQMIVESLSLSGAGLKTAEDNTLRPNEILHIRFYLDPDHATQTLIHKNVVVRNITGRHVGVAFSEPETDLRVKRFLEKPASMNDA